MRELLATPRLAPLGPGQANESVRPRLERLGATEVFAPLVIRDQEQAQACLAGLWLYHDFLDESHAISQDLPSAEGSYWHGLMHRREPDFGNSKYWFRRVGRHPIFQPLAQAAADLAKTAEPHPALEFLKKPDPWNPFTFIDLCEAAYHGRGPHEHLCRLIQDVEWQLLFEYCFRHAQNP
jgi:hypothetical protein